VGGRPSFGLNEGRPTIYSGVDATTEPRKQFVFSSAGLTVQSLIDEGLLDAPHRSSRAGAFERGLLAGGLATSFFYVTIGRTGSVSDVDFMARTSKLNKASITAIFGGVALAHTWRMAHNSRYANFFARPSPEGGLRVGMGDRIDREHSTTLAAGGFVSLPASMHHYAWTSTPTIVQISLEGPFDIFYVNPNDDPQKRQTSR